MSTRRRASENPLARYGAVLAVCALAGAIAGGVSGFMRETASPLTPLVIALATAVAMGAGLWACRRWWIGLDEAAQEAHKWAWWWGSTVGLGFGGVILFALAYGAPETLTTIGDPKDVFFAGAALVAVVQIVGYGVAWAAWWLKRR